MASGEGVRRLEVGKVHRVELQLDTAPREIEVPDDLAAALAAEPAAQAFFEGLSYSKQSWHVFQVTGAKKAETRQARVETSAMTGKTRSTATELPLAPGRHVAERRPSRPPGCAPSRRAAPAGVRR